MFRLVLLALLATQVDWAFSSDCPDGWKRYGDNCFWKSATKADREENLKKCTDMGASLVTIHDAGTNDFIKSFINNKDFWWMSAYRETNGNQFLWIDGSQMDYKRWGRGEPNDPHSRPACLAYEGNNGWVDQNCRQVLNQMCEIPVGVPLRGPCDCAALQATIANLQNQNAQQAALINSLNTQLANTPMPIIIHY